MGVNERRAARANRDAAAEMIEDAVSSFILLIAYYSFNAGKFYSWLAAQNVYLWCTTLTDKHCHLLISSIYYTCRLPRVFEPFNIYRNFIIMLS